MPDHYMDDIYSDINRKKQLEDAQENKEFDRKMDAYRRGKKNLTDEEKVDRLKDAARKKRLYNDISGSINGFEEAKKDPKLVKELQGIGFETAVNVATDSLTTALGWAPPLYAVVNFLSAGGANLVAQKMIRGEENISWGEAFGSGVTGTIPFMNPAAGKLTKVVGKPQTIKRAVVGGGLTGVGYQQIEKGINERRVISPTEAVSSFATGGVVSGTFKGTTDLGKRIVDQIKGIAPMGDLAYGLGGTGGARATSGGSIGPFRASYVEPEFEHTAKILQRLFNNNLTIGGRERRFNFIKLQNDRSSQEAINSNFRRQLGVDISTTEYYKIGQSFQNQRRDEMGIFTALYGDAMRDNKIRQINPTTGKPELVSSPIDPSQIELDHRVTLMQSLGMYHNTAYGSDLWNDIQRTALNRMDPRTGRGYKPGDTVDNLGLVDPESHRVKTKFFNDLHGKSSGGMKYWRGKHRDTGMSRLDIMSNSHTDKTLNGKSYRDMHLEIVGDYFDHIDKGSKILDDALATWDVEMKDELFPDHIAERLGKVALDAETYDYTPTKLKEIITDIILDAGPRRSKEDWALAFGDVAQNKLKVIEDFSKKDRAFEMILDRAGIYADKNGNTVLGRKYTDAQIKQKYFPTVPKEESDITMKQLSLVIEEVQANPKIKENLIELMKARRGTTPGNIGKPTYEDPSDKGLE